MRRSLLLLAVVAGGAASLGLAEGAVRLRERRAPGPNAMPLMYYRHRRMEHAFVRGGAFQDRVHINRAGFRGADVERLKAAGTTRIMAVGASATFDHCASSDAAAWPARLEDALNAAAGAGAHRFEVINAGVPGVLMLDNIIRLHTELWAYKPDVIMLYAGHGTISPEDIVHAMRDASAAADSGPARPDAIPVATPWGEWLAEHSLLYNKVMSRFRRGGPSLATAPGARQWEDGIVNATDAWRRDLKTFVLIAQSTGAKVVVIELAHLNGAQPPTPLSAADSSIWQHAFPAPPSVVLEGYRRFSAVQRSVSDSLHARFVGANSFGITGRPLFCRNDPIHFSDAGAQLMGQHLARVLLADTSLQLAGATSTR